MKIALVIFNLTLVITCLKALEFKYHNYDDLTGILTKYATDYSNKTYLYSIGKSVQGKSNRTIMFDN